MKMSEQDTQLPALSRAGHASHCFRFINGERHFRLRYILSFTACVRSTCDQDRSRPITVILTDLNELLMLHSDLCRRLAIAFYCIGSLDLLGELEGRIPQAERESWREWVWEQQAGRQFGARRRTLLTPSSLRRGRTWDWL